MEGSNIDPDELNVNEMEEVRKTHINDCIDSVSNFYPKLRIEDHYNKLSEMCHPNLGSNMLVFANRKKLGNCIGGVVLFSRSETCGGARMFFEMTCEPMISAFSIENNNMIAAKKILTRYQLAAKYTQSVMEDLIR